MIAFATKQSPGSRRFRAIILFRGNLKRLRRQLPKPLRFQIFFIKQGRIEKLCNTNTESLTHLVDDPELYGIVSAVHYIANGRLGHTVFYVELILCHAIHEVREYACTHNNLHASYNILEVLWPANELDPGGFIRPKY